MGLGDLLTEDQQAELLRLAGEGNGPKNSRGEDHGSSKLPLFPDEAWVGLFAEYRELVGSSTEAPDAYHWAVFLTAVGLLLGHDIWINNPHPLRPNFNTALIGRTGTSRKTTALRFGENLLEKMGREVEVFPGVVSSEGIYQKLAEKEGTRLLLYADEFRGLMDVAKRQGTRDLIPKLNSLYNCPSVDAINRRQQPVKAVRPFVSLITASPLAWLEESLESGYVSGGFLNRFLFLAGDEKEANPFPEPPHEEHWNRITVPLNTAIKACEDNPGPMGWAGEARELYADFYKKWKAKQKNLSDDLADLTNRIPDHVLKIAMVYSALEGKRGISALAVAIAITVSGYLENMTHSLFGSVSLTRIGRVEKMIIDRLKARSGRMVLRQLRQSLGSKVDTEGFNRAIQNLERNEAIRIDPEDTLAGRQRKVVVLLD